MRRVETRALVLFVALTAATAAFAGEPPSGGSPTPPTRAARLLGEGLTAAGAGVILPVASYVTLTTALSSFTGFFAGIATATVLGALIAPAAVIIASQLLGLRGGVGRGLLGALIGLVVGALVGLPLATVPGAGYVVGLALFWALPSLGTIVGLEWGQATAPPPAGLTVARF